MSRRHPERDLICAVAGCTNPHPDDKAICGDCYGYLPRYLRSDLAVAKRRCDEADAQDRPAARASYRAAVDAAVRSVEDTRRA